MDLLEFANKHRKKSGTVCLGCQLSEDLRAAVRAGREAPVPISYPTISAWLQREHGITLKPGTLRSHYVNHEEHSA